MNIAFVVLVVLALLLVNEWWWHKRTHGEISRKFVHITVGTFVAAWPLILGWKEIEFLSLAFVAAVVVSRQFNIFKAIHAVERPTWGELYFGAAVGLIAITTHQPAIYAAALLHMSLADGLAAVVGEQYGRRTTYRVFGAKKSRVGTLTFLVMSLAILVAYSVHQDINLGLWLPLIAGGAAVIENVAVRGLDNLLIPLFVALLLGLAS
jgi:phytol kinase